MRMDAMRIIQDAIESRSPIHLKYDGDGGARRVVHPHCLFRSSAGNVCLDAYQVDGYSSTDNEPLPKWRQFDLVRIIDVDGDGSGPFPTAPGWNPEGPKYSGGIIACI